MKKIWKYEVTVGANSMEMPLGAVVVHVGKQGGMGCLWAIHDTKNDKRVSPRLFEVTGTGQNFPEGSTYIGTYLDTPYVWHVCEVVE